MFCAILTACVAGIASAASLPRDSEPALQYVAVLTPAPSDRYMHTTDRIQVPENNKPKGHVSGVQSTSSAEIRRFVREAPNQETPLSANYTQSDATAVQNPPNGHDLKKSETTANEEHDAESKPTPKDSDANSTTKISEVATSASPASVDGQEPSAQVTNNVTKMNSIENEILNSNDTIFDNRSPTDQETFQGQTIQQITPIQTKTVTEDIPETEMTFTQNLNHNTQKSHQKPSHPSLVSNLETELISTPTPEALLLQDQILGTPNLMEVVMTTNQPPTTIQNQDQPTSQEAVSKMSITPQNGTMKQIVKQQVTSESILNTVPEELSNIMISEEQNSTVGSTTPRNVIKPFLNATQSAILDDTPKLTQTPIVTPDPISVHEIVELITPLPITEPDYVSDYVSENILYINSSRDSHSERPESDAGAISPPPLEPIHKDNVSSADSVSFTAATLKTTYAPPSKVLLTPLAFIDAENVSLFTTPSKAYSSIFDIVTASPSPCAYHSNASFDISSFDHVTFTRVSCPTDVAIFDKHTAIDSGLTASLFITIYKRLGLWYGMARLIDELSEYTYTPADFV